MDLNQVITRTAESDCGGGRGFSVNNNELERSGTRERSKEVIESPLKGIQAVFAVVDPDDHHRLLRRRHWSSDSFFSVQSETSRERVAMLKQRVTVPIYWILFWKWNLKE